MPRVSKEINLIPVKENERLNQQCTTAKALYEFLEMNPTAYARWLKTNLLSNEAFKEGLDYAQFDTMSNRISKDAYITIEVAKHLAMMSRSAKGHEARQYFLKIEKAFKESHSRPKQIVDLNAGLRLAGPTEEVPELTTRSKLGMRIDIYLNEKYGESYGEHFSDAWVRLYKELYWRHSLSPTRRRLPGESKLDACERLGWMEKLYALACYLFPTSNDII